MAARRHGRLADLVSESGGWKGCAPIRPVRAGDRFGCPPCHLIGAGTIAGLHLRLTTHQQTLPSTGCASGRVGVNDLLLDFRLLRAGDRLPAVEDFLEKLCCHAPAFRGRFERHDRLGICCRVATGTLARSGCVGNGNGEAGQAPDLTPPSALEGSATIAAAAIPVELGSTFLGDVRSLAHGRGLPDVHWLAPAEPQVMSPGRRFGPRKMTC
jgi:hypothetical protein